MIIGQMYSIVYKISHPEINETPMPQPPGEARGKTGTELRLPNGETVLATGIYIVCDLSQLSSSLSTPFFFPPTILYSPT
jgi:hypothetical protein